MNFANIQKQTIEQIPCTPNHKWNGEVPGIGHKHLDGEICDCGRFILKYYAGCGCSGKDTRRIEYVENPDYRPQF